MFFSTTPLARIKFIAIILLAVFLSACGGGGSSSSGQSTSGGSSGGGGGSSGGGSTAIVSPMGCGTVTSTGTGNTTPIVIDGFPCAAAGTAGAANDSQEPYISVKICAPGSTTNCQIIDHIILDSGSSGLRIAAAALNSSLQPNAGLNIFNDPAAPGVPLTECEQYVDSYAYGPLVNVDVYIAGESVKSTPIQVFGVSGYTAPGSCSATTAGDTNTGTNTVSTFGGNGLLGVNFLTTDMGLFYDCTSVAGSSCNPNYNYAMPSIVNQFAIDYNGVAITLPSISSTGATTPVQGTLTFGISTRLSSTAEWTANTPLASTLALVNDGNWNDLTTTYGTFNVQAGSTWTPAYIDSGTGTAFFPAAANAGLTACASTSNFSAWYCPTSTVSASLSYANFGSISSLATVSLPVANPTYLTNSTIAFSNIAGPNNNTSTINSYIALGLTTFFGYTNYFLFDQMTAPGTNLGGGTTVTGPINGIVLTP